MDFLLMILNQKVYLQITEDLVPDKPFLYLSIFGHLLYKTILLPNILYSFLSITGQIFQFVIFLFKLDFSHYYLHYK